MYTRIIYIVILFALNLVELWGQRSYQLSELRIRPRGLVNVYNLRQGGEALEGAALIYEGKRKYIEVVFRSGQMQGKYCEYLDGRLSRQGRYEEGLRTGVWQEFFPSGALSRERHYRSGTVHGVDISYFTNGQVECKKYYRNNKLSGKELRYNSSGELVATYHWQEGEREGQFFKWEDLGEGKRCHTKGYYRADKLHGAWNAIFYDSEGEAEYQIERYYEDGKLLREEQSSVAESKRTPPLRDK